MDYKGATTGIILGLAFATMYLGLITVIYVYIY